MTIRTLRNTANAKHIAAQCGLTFTYQRSARVWLLAARHFTPEQSHSIFAPSIIADYSTDEFYNVCMRIAAHTATAEQMNKVIERARHAELFDRLEREGRDLFTADERAEWLTLNPTSNDKQVHEVENAIYQMRMDAEEVSGTYAEHKARFAGVRAVASYGGGKHIGYSVDGRFVMSLPAQLNNMRIPCPEECDDILNGESVLESDGWRFRARDLHDLARRIVDDMLLMVPGSKVGATMVATSDGTTTGQRYVMWCGARRHTLSVLNTTVTRLFLHWSGFVDNCRIDAEGEQARAAAASDELPPPPAVVYLDVEHIEAAPAPVDPAHILAAVDPLFAQWASDDEENARAIAAEQARAAAARDLSQGR